MILVNVQRNSHITLKVRDEPPVVVSVKPGGSPGEIYEGSYDVTPEVEAQTLHTKNKTMAQDLSIRAIPYYDVSNTSGGSTIYIGMEV